LQHQTRMARRPRADSAEAEYEEIDRAPAGRTVARRSSGPLAAIVANVLGQILFVLLMSVPIMIVGAVLALAFAFGSSVLARWTGLPASHILAAMLSIVATLVVGFGLVAAAGGVESAIRDVVRACDDLGEERLACQFERTLREMDAELVPSRSSRSRSRRAPR
jgi:uncharacterized membrane protein